MDDTLDFHEIFIFYFSFFVPHSIEILAISLVKGVSHPIKIQKRVKKLSKRNVELVSPKIVIKESVAVEKKVIKETKEVRGSF